MTKNYDDGEIVFQKSIPVDPKDTPEMIAQKVLILEHAALSVSIRSTLVSPPNLS